jgi:hypothetical protein
MSPMYRPLNTVTLGNGEQTILTGVQAARDWVAGLDVAVGPDGLTFVTPDGDHFQDVAISERLRDWLVGLRLLRNVPLSYLVPDARLLPPESIRFFYLDQNWVERVIDGVFAAASAGTIASSFHVAMLQLVRNDLDTTLIARASEQASTSWSPAEGPTTGMLIRSELARRWPDMIVTAHAGLTPDTAVVPVLRAEPISRDVFIAIFAGEPKLVQVREPHVGVRFGVEPKFEGPSVPPYKVDQRTATGENLDDEDIVEIPLRAGGDRVIRVEELANRLVPHLGPDGKAPRFVALHLEQRPYVQKFTLAVPEPTGSLPLPTNPDGTFVRTLGLRKNRVMRMHDLIARQTQQTTLSTSSSGNPGDND